jgi:neutral ceramidase
LYLGAALVPCDLGWPSFMVQRQIAERVQRELGHVAGSKAPPPIGAEDIVLFATHTHAAPGHPFASTNDSGLMSSPQPGYSDEVAAFVAEQIALGIAEAYRELAPARIGGGFTELHGVSKNRSLDALANNLLTPEERASLEGGRVASLARRAIDPRLAVLRVDDLSGAPIGGLAVLGVHGTSIPSTSE